MQKPKKIIRTSLGAFLSNPEYSGAGIYVVACCPSLGCLYVGISYDVQSRLRQHTVEDKPFSGFLVQTLRPTFNTQHLGA